MRDWLTDAVATALESLFPPDPGLLRSRVPKWLIGLAFFDR
jgi:hypothetical protein